MGDRIGSIPVLLDPPARRWTWENEIKALLKVRHRVAPDDERALSGFNRDKSFNRFAEPVFRASAP